MLPGMGQGGSPQERRLRQIFRELAEQDQATLLRFAEFLVAAPTALAPAEPLPEPVLLERPAQESVVKAIKRLTASYPMLNPDELLHRTSDLMSSHVIKGRSAPEVIDDLELMFAEHYQQVKARLESAA